MTVRFVTPRPRRRGDGVRAVGAARAFRDLPARDAARSRALRSRDVLDCRHRRGADRQAPDPRILEQPAARRAGRSRRNRAGFRIRVHRRARAPAPCASHRDGRERAPAARLAAVHDGDRDDLLVRSARAHHLRLARPQGRDRVRALQHSFLRGAHLFPDRLPDAAAADRRHRFQHRGNGALARRVALACLSHGDLAACAFPGSPTHFCCCSRHRSPTSRHR